MSKAVILLKPDKSDLATAPFEDSRAMPDVSGLPSQLQFSGPFGRGVVRVLVCMRGIGFCDPCHSMEVLLLTRLWD